MGKKTTRLLTAGLLAVLLCVLAAAGLAAAQHAHRWIEVSRTEATCTKPGTVTYECASCGEKKTEQTSSALGHNWGSWKTTKEPTCSKAGSKTRTCSRCGKKETQSIPATGKHSFVWKTVKEATCAEKGKEEQVCVECKAKGRTRSVAATGKHQYGEWKVTKAASCESKGTETRKCKTCDKKETRSVSALGHSWDKGVITQPAGLLEPGVKTYTCGRCGKTKTEEIPAEKPKSGSIMDLLRNGPDGPAEDLPLSDGNDLRIVKQPEGGTIDRNGAALSMSAEAAGGTPPYAYKWKRSYIGNNPWASLAIYLANAYHPLTADGNVCHANAGNFAYYCVVTDKDGNKAVSERADVYYTLSIEKQPKDANIYGRDTVTLSCSAVNGRPFGEDYKEPYDYAWYTDGWDSAGHGQTVTIDREGAYFCVVQDAAGGSVTSATARVYSAEDLAIEGLSDVMPEPGKSVTLTATVTGGLPPYTYEWEYTPDEDAVYMPDGSVLPDEKDASITVPDEKRGWYRLTAADDTGEWVSQWVQVKKYVKPLTITEASFEMSILVAKEGAAAYARIADDGTPPYTFVLRKEGEDQESKETSDAEYTFKVYEPGCYAIHIEDSEGREADTKYYNIEDDSLKIVDFTGEIIIQDLNDTGNYLEVKAEGGSGIYTYKWDKVSFNESLYRKVKPENIPDRTEEPSFGSMQQVFYPYSVWKCIVTDLAGGKALAYPMRVRYNAPLTIVKQPESVSVSMRNSADLPSATFTCKAVGPVDHPLEYIWQGKGFSGWFSYNPSSKNTLTVTESVNEEKQTRYILASAYRCIVRDTVTGEELMSSEARVMWPELKITVFDNNVHIYGGRGPYRVSVVNRIRNKAGDYEDQPVDERKIKETGGRYNSAEFIITGLKKKGYLMVTVTDISGQKTVYDGVKDETHNGWAE